MQLQLILYTRPGCHLCEDAKLVLSLLKEEIPFDLVEMDISKDDELTEKYGLYIPVLAWGDEIIQYGQIVAKEVKHFLKGKLIHSNS